MWDVCVCRDPNGMSKAFRSFQIKYLKETNKKKSQKILQI